MSSFIYLDHNSTTDIIPFSYLSEFPLNPSSVHRCGKAAKNLLEKARSDILTKLGSKCYNLLFTSSCSVANNLVIFGLLSEGKVCNKVFTFASEHSSILEPVKRCFGCILDVLPSGYIDLDVLHSKLKENPRSLVCVMFANNETGVLQDIKTIADICHQYDSILHVDATQAIGRVDFSLSSLDCDVMTFSGHKIGAGFGCACIVFKAGILFEPYLFGGGQEKFVFPGTHNLHSILAIENAVKTVCDTNYIQNYSKHTLLLQKHLEDGVYKIGGEVLGFGSKRLSNTTMLSNKRLKSEELLILSDLNGICISNGSACSSGKVSVSHVALSYGKAIRDASCFVRVSSSLKNTLNEIDLFLSLL